jgi:hypothetical protein
VCCSCSAHNCPIPPIDSSTVDTWRRETHVGAMQCCMVLYKTMLLLCYLWKFEMLL